MSISEKTNEGSVQKLVKSFFNNSLNFSLLPHEVKLMNWEKQHEFLTSTIRNKIVQKYPISSEFCRLFLKKLIDFLEPSQEVHDDLYSSLCSVLINSTNEEFCYRHYIIRDEFQNLITIKETKNMVVNGTTGMKTWQAGLMLADWIICNKNIFQNKNILELGSGVGFTGIAVAKNCNIQSMLFTDCHPDVLKTICDNIEINFSLEQEVKYEDNAERIFKIKEKTLGVIMLDWNSVDNMKTDIVPDIVIGADIIYDPSILQPLCNTLKSIFERNKYLEVYIANIIRNEETYKSFINILASANLTCEEISHTKSVIVNWDENIQKCLLRIKTV